MRIKNDFHIGEKVKYKGEVFTVAKNYHTGFYDIEQREAVIDNEIPYDTCYCTKIRYVCKTEIEREKVK